jgi:hypothetical protein
VAGQRERCCTCCLLAVHGKLHAVLTLCLCLSSNLGCSSTHCYGRCIQTAGLATSSNNLCLSMRGATTGSRHACLRLNESHSFGLNLLSAAVGTVCSTAVPTQLLQRSYSACAAAGPATAAGRNTVPKSKAILFLSHAHCDTWRHGHTSGHRRDPGPEIHDFQGRLSRAYL